MKPKARNPVMIIARSKERIFFEFWDGFIPSYFFKTFEKLWLGIKACIIA